MRKIVLVFESDILPPYHCLIKDSLFQDWQNDSRIKSWSSVSTLICCIYKEPFASNIMFADVKRDSITILSRDSQIYTHYSLSIFIFICLFCLPSSQQSKIYLNANAWRGKEAGGGMLHVKKEQGTHISQPFNVLNSSSPQIEKRINCDLDFIMLAHTWNRFL